MEDTEFACSLCGETHERLLTNIAFELPDAVSELAASERMERAKFDTDLCIFEERYFIRALLKVPFIERNTYFGWGVWVEVEGDAFGRYLEVYDKDGSAAYPESGTLANLIPGNEDADQERVSLQFGPSDQRPLVSADDSSTSSLASAQRRGIDDAEHHRILVAVADYTATS